MKPSIGRIVVYKTTERYRNEVDNDRTAMPRLELPAIISYVHPEGDVNLKVFEDGYISREIWRTNVTEGDKEGQWHWPVIQPQIGKAIIRAINAKE